MKQDRFYRASYLVWCLEPWATTVRLDCRHAFQGGWYMRAQADKFYTFFDFYPIGNKINTTEILLNRHKIVYRMDRHIIHEPWNVCTRFCFNSEIFFYEIILYNVTEFCVSRTIQYWISFNDISCSTRCEH